LQFNSDRFKRRRVEFQQRGAHRTALETAEIDPAFQQRKVSAVLKQIAHLIQDMLLMSGLLKVAFPIGVEQPDNHFGIGIAIARYGGDSPRLERFEDQVIGTAGYLKLPIF
jgi:hypothetical protein